jgi:hypothetical protein
MMKKFMVIGALAILGSNCGGGNDAAIDEGPSNAMAGTADPGAMKSSVVQADGLTTAISSKNGAQISSAALALSLGGMEAVREGMSQPLSVVMSTIAATTSDKTTGTMNCNETGCTFDAYGANGFTVSGSVTASDAMGGGKHVVWNLSGSGNEAAAGGQSSVQNLDFHFAWKGDLTVSPTSLVGAAGASWAGSGTVNGQSFSFDYGSLLKFQNVTIANHCPTGGSVFAKQWLTANAGGQSQVKAYQATHTFNGCAN